MLYIGHFSFSFESRGRGQATQPWHGYFTAVAEAPNVSSALKKLEALVRTSAESSELFTDVRDVYLESCVEVKSVPRGGFLAYVALEEGESLSTISMSLPDVKRESASSYHLEPEIVDDDGGFDAEPFVVVPGKRGAKKSASKRPARSGAARKPARRNG
jgi:hypothetical protein